ncbi:hypothetical protein SBOR_8232 [Sclerotinia borealis F-4128]|uniref:Macro domain-containing protein n=1 Tax=Sclerotinia borealis (strain F-4128) TaxID=1432307 RepID=W9CA16_SCLBF|nr:hypothetical protein SBOR_8232 [Sclerotinia borealis F-4128]
MQLVAVASSSTFANSIKRSISSEKRCHIYNGHREVDTSINTANKTSSRGGDVDGAIYRAAGPSLLRECRTTNGYMTGSAKIKWQILSEMSMMSASVLTYTCSAEIGSLLNPGWKRATQDDKVRRSSFDWSVLYVYCKWYTGNGIPILHEWYEWHEWVYRRPQLLSSTSANNLFTAKRLASTSARGSAATKITIETSMQTTTPQLTPRTCPLTTACLSQFLGTMTAGSQTNGTTEAYPEWKEGVFLNDTGEIVPDREVRVF